MNRWTFDLNGWTRLAVVRPVGYSAHQLGPDNLTEPPGRSYARAIPWGRRAGQPAGYRRAARPPPARGRGGPPAGPVARAPTRQARPGPPGPRPSRGTPRRGRSAGRPSAATRGPSHRGA